MYVFLHLLHNIRNSVVSLGSIPFLATGQESKHFSGVIRKTKTRISAFVFHSLNSTVFNPIFKFISMQAVATQLIYAVCFLHPPPSPTQTGCLGPVYFESLFLATGPTSFSCDEVI